MSYYAILAIATTTVLILGHRLWMRTHNISLPLGLAFLYYWTLQGAWVIVRERLSAASNSNYHYSGYQERLFPILLDSTYFEALLVYSLFLIVVAAVLFAGGKRPPRWNPSSVQPIHISHWRMISIAAISGGISFWIIQGALSTAMARSISGYEFTRNVFSTESPFFTLHQLLNRVALLAASLGFGVWWTGARGRYVLANRSHVTFLAYVALLAGLLYLMFLLGNRNELVFAGFAGMLFYMVNAPRARVLVGAAILAGLLLSANFIYFLRGTAPAGRTVAEKAFDASGLVDFVKTSNEQFVSHFSLYGAIKQDIPLTYGSSIVSLATSTIPRVLWKERPRTIYDHYAEAVKAAPGQGYTIHHATGWYLNFGLPGVVIGAALLGFVWAKLFNWFYEASSSSLFFRSAQTLAVWAFVADLPSLVRGGPEAYKSLIFETILIPAGIVVLSATNCVLTPTLTPGRHVLSSGSD